MPGAKKTFKGMPTHHDPAALAAIVEEADCYSRSEMHALRDLRDMKIMELLQRYSAGAIAKALGYERSEVARFANRAKQERLRGAAVDAEVDVRLKEI